jgi:hypothetical protein
MDIFTLGLIILVIICFISHCYTRSTREQIDVNLNLAKFQKSYLVVYLLAMCKYILLRSINIDMTLIMI